MMKFETTRSATVSQLMFAITAEIRVAGLSDDAKRKIEKIIEEDKSKLIFCGNPTTSLEDLFHDIIAESEARPGKRVRGGENAK